MSWKPVKDSLWERGNGQVAAVSAGYGLVEEQGGFLAGPRSYLERANGKTVTLGFTIGHK